MAKSGKKSVEEMFADITAQLSTLMPLVDSVKKLTDKVTGLQITVAEAQKENGKLMEDLAERDRTIEDLKSQLSEATQYQRQWSIRVIGLQIPDSQKKKNFHVPQILYRNLLLPILEGAVAAGDIPSVPAVDQLIERAHILPSSANKPSIVIDRFFSRDYKDLCFKHRKQFQPYSTSTPPTRSTTRAAPRPLYQIYEDLNRTIFTKMRALAAHDSVHAAWTSSGTNRLRLKNDPDKVLKVRRPTDTVDKILSELTP